MDEQDKGGELVCIDISGLVLKPEPMDRGWQVHVEGNTALWARGATRQEAVGVLILRLAHEHEGANFRRSRCEGLPIAGEIRPLGAADLKRTMEPRWHCRCGTANIPAYKDSCDGCTTPRIEGERRS